MFKKPVFILYLITICLLFNSCDSFIDQACTAEFRSIGVTVFTTENEPVILDEFTVTKRQFHSEGELEICGNGFDCENGKPAGYPQQGFYVIFHDGMRSKIKGGVMKVTASGKKDEIEFKEDFLISSDGCHVSKEAGPDTVYVETN